MKLPFVCLTTTSQRFLLAIGLLLCSAGGLQAAIQIPIISDAAGGARFTFLHTNGDNGTNNKFMSGRVTDNFGTVSNDAFFGNYNSTTGILTITGGSMTGTTGPAGSGTSGTFRQDYFGDNSVTDAFVKFTAGKLKFYGGTDKLVGGWIDYEIFKGTSATNPIFDEGTLFFEAANILGNTNSPNWGTVEGGFHLWGNNFAYSDTKDSLDNWDFLDDGLGYSDNHEILPTRHGYNSDSVNHNLGADISTEGVPGAGQNPVPEAGGLLTWSLLFGVVVMGYSRRKNALASAR